MFGPLGTLIYGFEYTKLLQEIQENSKNTFLKTILLNLGFGRIQNSENFGKPEKATQIKLDNFGGSKTIRVNDRLD